MLHTLAVVVLLQGPPMLPGMAPPGAPGGPSGAKKVMPPASETAKLYFLAGDVAKAVEWATRGVKIEPKRCKPMLKALAEYGFLAGRSDDFTPEQARDFIRFDAQISPGTPGKLTQPILQRFVEGPLTHAERLIETGRIDEALALLDRVELVVPGQAKVKHLRKAAQAPRDAGVAPVTP